MRVTVLGPISAVSDGEHVAVSTNQRLLVAVLAAHAGSIVSTDLLVETLWGDALPAKPLASLQNLVSRLRARMVGDDLALLQTRPPGYGLMLDHESVDRLAFEHLLARARATTDDQLAIEAFDTALGVWGGTPYAEFGDVPSLREDAVRLEELRAMGREERLARLVRFDAGRAVAELEALVEAAPYRERGHALLMEVLHRTGRQRDALRAYGTYRSMMINELGLDPSPAMQQLERDVLANTLEAPHVDASGSTLLVSASADRHNLPRRRTSFVGRGEHVEAIGAMLVEHRLVTLGRRAIRRRRLARRPARVDRRPTHLRARRRDDRTARARSRRLDGIPRRTRASSSGAAGARQL